MKSGSSGTIKFKSVLQRHEIERFVNNRSQLIRVLNRRRGNRGDTQWNVDYIVSIGGDVFITAIKCYNTFSESVNHNGIQQLISECVKKCLKKYFNDNIISENLKTHDNEYNIYEKLDELDISYDFINERENIIEIRTPNKEIKNKVLQLLNYYGWKAIKDNG